MAQRPPSGDARVELTSSMKGERGTPDPELPFCLLILGGFGGSPAGPVVTRRIHRVDRDDLEELPGRLGVRTSIEFPGGGRVDLAFRELQDFHPDRIVAGLAPFDELRGIRGKLEDPRTFVEAAKAVRTWAGEAPAARPPAPLSQPSEPSDDVMRDLLAGAARQPKRSIDAAFEAELKEIVRPHLVPATSADLPGLLSAVDDEAGRRLRGILRDRRFQSLEAAWRGLDLLVRRTDEEAVKIFVLDLSREDLARDLTGAPQLEKTGLHHHLVTETLETPGAEPWGAILGLYEFGPSLADAALLVRLAKLARAAGAPFLSAASPELLGCRSLAASPDPATWRPSGSDGEAVWAEIRTLPEAAWVALALPRLLLRLPYGAKTDPIEAFPFEEIPVPPDHEAYLWGNPALAPALVLAGAFATGRWALRPETAAEIENLPSHVWEHGGEAHVTPPSEVVLTLRAAERILEAGLVPVLSLKGSESVRVARLQSIASPLRALAGRWEG